MAGKLNVGALVNGLNSLHNILVEIAPIAQAIGGPVVANVATIGIAATATIQNVLERGDSLKTAMTEQDATKLRAMLSDLQAVNDRLAGTIADVAEEAATPPDKGDTGDGDNKS